MGIAPRSWLLGSWLLAALALLPSSALAAAPDPAPDGGRLQTRVATAADPAQQYDLFLPSGYPGERRWPVLIILDPRGRTEWILAQARRGAAANGWLLLASYQSRSDDREQFTMGALQALLREVGTRYAYDPRRVYVAGMSGTAKSLWLAEESLHGLVAGYIGAGGGRPPELGRFKRPPPDFFGFAGNLDFNYQEMRELDAALAQARGSHRLDVFEGGHGWPRADGQFSDAIDWLELMAMREGRAPRRQEFIAAQLSRERVSLAAAGTPLERWRRLEQLRRDFDGLADVAGESAQATQLAASAEVRAAQALESRLRDEEHRFAQQLDAWATRMNGGPSEGGRLPPPELARTLAELRIRSLQARAKDPDPVLADSAARRLERAWVAAAHYVAEARRRQGDLVGERAALRFANAVYPEREYARCMLAALAAGSGRKPSREDPLACRAGAAAD